MLSNIFTALMLLVPVAEIEDKKSLGSSTVWIQEGEDYSFNTAEEALSVFAEGAYEGPRVKKGANLGIQKYPSWFLARVKNNQESIEHVLSFQAAALDSIEFWVLRADSLESYAVQGDKYSVSRRFYPERMANYKVDIAPGENVFLLYKIKTTSPANGIVEIQKTRSYTIDSMIDNAVLWFIYGMIGIMLVYHIFLAASLKSRLYWIYSLYILFTLISQMNTQGHFFQYVNGDTPEFSGPLMLVYNITIILMIEFAIMFLDLRKYAPGTVKFMRGTSIVLIAIGSLYFLVNPIVYNKVFMPFAIITPIMVLAIAVIAAKNGQRAARFFILSFAVVLSAIVIFLLKNLAILPLTPFVQFAMPIGTGCQLTLMALALGDRMRIIEDDARKAKEKQLREEAAHRKEITKLNESLEIRVDEQTRDIKSMLVSTKIGLLSITVDFSLHKDYSAHLETIVGEENLAGRSFLDLILDKSDLGPDDRDKIITAIEYTIGEDEMFFDVNADCFPHELKAELPGGLKHLDLDWSPVLDKEECIERILVSVKDITETIALRQQAEDGKRSLRYLGEIIEVGPEQFENFIQGAEKTWSEIREILNKNHANETLTNEESRQIFIGLHTIKGAARFYKFGDFTDAVHVAEEVTSAKSSLGPEAFKKLFDHMQEIDHIHEYYCKALEPLMKIKKKSQSSEMDHLDKYDINRLVYDMSATANDLAREIGKGGCQFKSDIPDGTILTPEFHEALAKTFIHLLRNSIDHGLEMPDVRVKDGKPEQGTLRVFLDDEGRLCFEDDGQGLNLKAIEAKAKSVGMVVNGRSKLAELIFNSGFSTKDAADEVSGRGVGMDAVREFMRNAGSDIAIIPQGHDDGDFMKIRFAINMPVVVKAA